ncbi:MAG: sulfate permease [Nocardioides sp.]|uniref:sulfate permease n=1 Tax=Nocardioides sp. TaxID=35761 RepID=UPI0039E6520B
MIRFAIIATARAGWFLRCYAPSNIMLDAIRSRRGLKWGIPAALVLVPAYLYGGSIAITLIERGGPGWLNLVVLILIWDALKFAVMAPVSIALLVRTRLAERSRRTCRRFVPMGCAPGRGVGPWTTSA